MKHLLWTLPALVLIGFADARAQSLAELAEKEKERRAKLDDEDVPSFTEADLSRNEGPLTQSTVQTPADTDAEGEGGEEEGAESETPDPTQTQSYWRDRARRIDQRIRELETKLQSPLYTQNPRGALERQALEQDLAQVRAERRALEEEARRQGVPPGWLR